MKTAAAYVRVSTDDQLEYSPESQLKLLKEYAKKNDYILPDEFIFQDDGISGKDAKHRPSFNKMIALAKSDEHPIDTILVWKFSRFARNQEESIVIKNLLRKVGVEVRSISEPVDPDSAFGSLIERIIEWMDEYYLINLSGEVKRGMLERVSRGEAVTVPPFGYVMTDGKLYPDPEKADIVRSVFSSYLAGEGKIRIARRLGAEGIKTRRGNPPDNRFVEYMLNNPVYIGKIRWSKNGRAASTRHYDSENIIIVDGIHEPIISLETWDAVQEKIAAQKKAYPKYQRKEQLVDFMLKGLVRCSSCGATLCQLSSGESLQCHNYNRGICKTSHCISMKKINKAVEEGLQKAVDTLNFELVPKSIKSEHNADVSKLIAAEQRKLARIKAAYENGTDTLEEYSANKKKILAAIAKLEAEDTSSKKNQISRKDFAKKINSVLNIIRDPKQSELSKNQALRSIVDSIIFYRKTDTIKIVYYI